MFMRYCGWLVLCLFSSSLWAADALENRFYVGGALGFTELDDDGMGNYQSLDDNSGSFRLFGGYNFNSWLAAEVAMDLLGYYEGDTLTSEIENTYSSLTLSLVGRMPLGNGLSAFVQGGGGAVTLSQWVDGLIGPFYYDDEYEANSGFATVWGAGLSYVIPDNEQFEVRAGYLQTNFEVEAIAINNLGFLQESEYDQSIERFYLGVVYHF